MPGSQSLIYEQLILDIRDKKWKIGWRIAAMLAIGAIEPFGTNATQALQAISEDQQEEEVVRTVAREVLQKLHNAG